MGEDPFLFSSPINLDENVDKIVFFNLPPKTLKKYALNRLPKEKIVLFLWEPKTVLPGMYASAIFDGFSKIYTWDDSLVDGEKFCKFNYGVLSEMIEDIPAFKEKKFCTLMASNLKSSYPCELYSEREKVIDFFEQNGEENFEFWGRGWDSGLHRSYRGPAADKINVIKNYRFSICYENTSDALGYITEKIFECFQAGTVPVYWGAPNVIDYIPKSCFIDRRDFATMEALYQFLKEMSEERYEEYLTHIRHFLRSDAAQQFGSTQLEEAFYRAVVDH